MALVLEMSPERTSVGLVDAVAPLWVKLAVVPAAPPRMMSELIVLLPPSVLAEEMALDAPVPVEVRVSELPLTV